MRLTLVADFFKRVIIVFSPEMRLLITDLDRSGLMSPLLQGALAQDYPAGLFEGATRWFRQHHQ